MTLLQDGESGLTSYQLPQYVPQELAHNRPLSLNIKV